jgi:D-amino peptidase
MNKYLLSVDIEGITGVINKNFADKNGKYYQLGCSYMLSDVNAVIQGILSVDVDCLILVRDAHGDAVNLNLNDLHPKANLIQGWGPSLNMLEGLDQSFKGIFLVGYHAGGENNKAVLSHSFSSQIHYIKVNDMILNEAGVAALYAGYFNVPVVFISGDDHAIKEAKKQINNNIVGAVVKQSFGRDFAMSLSLEQARAMLQNNAADAVTKLQQNYFSVFKTSGVIKTEIGFYNLGYRISVFQNLFEVLKFDQTYKFDQEKLAVIFESQDALELSKRLNVLMLIVYGIRSSS